MKKYEDLFMARREWCVKNTPNYPNIDMESWPKSEDFGYTDKEVKEYLEELRNRVDKNPFLDTLLQPAIKE